MSYLRGEWYVYGTDEDVVINGPTCEGTIPFEIFQTLVAIFWADMTEEERIAACKRALPNAGGERRRFFEVLTGWSH